MRFALRAGVLLSLLFGAGCSTFSVFSRQKSEDYNALTYGDQHNRRPDGQTGWAKDDNADAERTGRTPASVGSGGKGSIYRDMEDGSDTAALDPTDERVREQIESRRSRQSGQQARNGDRAIRSDFYDNTPNDGSLWSNENDANYFFTKGKVRAMGDIISVKMDEPMIRQIAEEVKKSLTPAEQEVEMALYLKNSDGAKDDKDIKAYRNVASEELKTTEAEEVKTRMEKAVRWSQVDLTKAIGLAPNEELRAEIIDRYQNGNYKIRAVKRVMYRGSSKLMSIVAVAPANDFDEKDAINSGKLYEHKIRIAR